MVIIDELTKLYYSIGEVSEMFGVSNSLIRYWESEFSHLKPKKNRKGDRRYTKKDILVIKRIYSLVKDQGYTLEGANKAMKQKPKLSSQKKTIDRLKKLKASLMKLKKSL